MLLVRADGGPGIGNGHVIRSLAVAEAWIDAGGDAVLAAHSLPEPLRAQATAAGVPVHAIDPGVAAIAGAVGATGADCVLFDGYDMDVSFHRTAHHAGSRVAVVDDHGTVGSYEADVVVDPNEGASRARLLVAAPGATVLAGGRYTLLRRQFRDADRVRRPARASVERLVVTLGGAPPDDARQRVEEALVAARLDAHVTVLAAGAPITDMAGLLGDADLALAAAGSTVWELCFMGVPMIVMPIADNQEPVAAALAGASAAVALPRDADSATIASALRRLAADAAGRQHLSERAQALVDGDGARRVVHAIRSRLLQSRPVVMEDADLLLRWANDTDTRAASFSTQPIGTDEHRRWMHERLRDQDSAMLLVSDRHGPIGLFRAARAGRVAVVGVVVAPERRGERWAAPLIAVGSRRLLSDGFADRLDAQIRPDNDRSVRAFEACGYRRQRVGVDEAADRLHYAVTAADMEEWV